MKKTKFKDRNKYKIGEIIIIVMFVLFLLPVISLIILKGVLTDFNLDIFIVPALFPIIIFYL